jgi:hypothetical protein
VAGSDRITSERERARERERRARRRTKRVLRWIGALLVLGLAFFAGLAVGRAVEGDQANGDQTLVRTLVPTTLAPPETVTVTVSNP